MADLPRTGDTVRHISTGELWTVAFADHRDLMWCGWPEGYVPTESCEVIERCTDAEHWKLVEEIAAMQNDPGQSDMRKRVCFALLEARREAECLEVMHL